jgi:hypothetical protein
MGKTWECAKGIRVSNIHCWTVDYFLCNFCLILSHQKNPALSYKLAMNDQILHSSSDRDWLLYALLELSSPAETMLITGDQLESLLMNTLHPLGLTPDFSNRVLATVHESVARIPVEMKQVRLLVYTPISHPIQGKTWGFFRIMKNRDLHDSPSGSKHEIALYLYIEGPLTTG